MIKTLCWTKNWMLCEYLCFGLSPEVFPPQTERQQLEETNSVHKRIFSFPFEGITCILLHLHKVSLFFPIYSKLHFSVWLLYSRFLSLNYKIELSSLSFKPFPLPTPIPITKNWCESIFVWSVLCWQELILKPTTLRHTSMTYVFDLQTSYPIILGKLYDHNHPYQLWYDRLVSS